MSLPKHVRLVEVGPRDGLQNEAKAVPAATKVELIERLADAGLTTIEAGAFVSPKRVPQMADSAEVLATLKPRAGVTYPVLVPNVQGYAAARAAGADHVAVFIAASETFSQRNTNCSIAESLIRVEEIATTARHDRVRVRGYISCVLGCPFEGDIAPNAVADLARRLSDLGCEEISLGDTIGIGTAGKVTALIEAAARSVAIAQLAVHFHDTYGQALANILAALQAGVSVVDSSVAGLGGCPFAPGATGNVATEDVLYMLDGLDIETGVKMDVLLQVGRFISAHLGRPPESRVNRALGARRTPG
jgi:hydroxymethylglutaryl-CoA lyase